MRASSSSVSTKRHTLPANNRSVLACAMGVLESVPRGKQDGGVGFLLEFERVRNVHRALCSPQWNISLCLLSVWSIKEPRSAPLMPHSQFFSLFHKTHNFT